MRRRTFLAGLSVATLAAGFAHTLRQAPPAWADATDVGPHPRLLLTSFDAPAQLVAANADAAGWFADVEAAAEALLEVPPSSYDLNERGQLLDVSREVVHRVYVLGFCYGIGGDERFLDRLWDELEAVCAFPDWNDDVHWLGTAEMTHAVALGYDWFHDSWSAEQRATMETAITANALQPGLALYEAQAGWVVVENNWNIVCNGGLIVGALAMADVQPALAQQIIDHALASLPLALAEYAPDGGYPEGVGSYWHYATKYLVLTIAALESALGDDHGLADSPGVSSTGDFPTHLSGPSGDSFNYYDAGESSPRPPEMFWLASRYDRPEFGWWGKDGADRNALSWVQSPASLLWYDPALTQSPIEAGTPLDASFALCRVFAARSGWEDDDAVFVAGKGGDNATNHSDLDLGDFVMDALGVRWACELGPDSYALPGYFDNAPDGQRWTYYRKRAEGQNTMVFAPASGPDQRTTAVGDLVRTETSPGEHLAVADLSESSDAVTSWRRGWRLFDGRRQVLVQDEVSAGTAVDAWWFLHTEAAITVADDGRSATLVRSGERVVAQLLEPVDAVFMQADAKPLWTSPDPAGQTANPTVRKLVVRLPDATTARVAVQLSPLHVGENVPTPAPVAPLEDWHVDDAATATLSAITVDGEPLAGFSPANLTYARAIEHRARVRAVPADRHGHAVVRAGRDGAVVIRVSAPGRARSTYRIWRSRAAQLEDPRRWEQTVVGSADDGNLPSHAIDGDPQTRWSAEGDGQWIGVDLGADGPVSQVQLAWYRGDSRRTSFDIQVASSRSARWRTVHSAESSGTSAGLESYSFETVRARFLRVVGHGSTASAWNSLSELAVPGRTLPAVTRETFLARLDVTAPDLAIGESARATITGTMSDGTTADLSGQQRAWVSNDETVATIDPEGVVVGTGPGTTDIAAVIVTNDHRLVYDRATVTVVDPGTRRYACVADTYVRDGSYADTVFGGWSTLAVKSSPNAGYTRISYLAFEPEPTADAIESITLSVFGAVTDSRGSAFDLDVAPVDGTIDEKTTTWDTRPALGERIGGTTVTDEQAWYDIDLTDALRDAVTAGSPLVLGLAQMVAAGVDGYIIDLASRTTDHPPVLTVTTG